jgi:4-amino-4-deoxy-L-arabinose transferase-like glycosyltransferase
MIVLPLTDSTEARYGDLSRLMFEQGYWLMPHVDAQTPFFAKPPLSMWISAGAAKFFGLSEFILRLPHLLMTLLAGWALWLAMVPMSTVARVFGLLVFTASPLVFVSAGAVMTDATQLASITWAMLAAWRVLGDEPSAGKWRVVFWIAAAAGALTKGIATLALIALPLALFAVTGGGIRRVTSKLFSALSLLLFAALVLPWYIAAERAYSGFLQYFLIGEHLMRFVDPGWTGDRYGFAHSVALGMIWPFWLGAILPWIGIFVMQAWRTLRPNIWRNTAEATRWWWCWLLAPLIFFTFSRNLIATYALTSVAPFVIIAAHWLEQCEWAVRRRWLMTSVLCVVPIYALVALFVPTQIEPQSALALVKEANHAGRAATEPIIFFDRYKFSGNYYTSSHAVYVDTANDLKSWLARPHSWIVASNEEIEKLKLLGQVEIISRARRATLARTLPVGTP